jgi:hypothetical protein
MLCPVKKVAECPYRNIVIDDKVEITQLYTHEDTV